MISNDLRLIPFKHLGFSDFPMITGVNLSSSSEQPNHKVNLSLTPFFIKYSKSSLTKDFGNNPRIPTARIL